MRTIETKVYTFDELSEAAKAKARDWFRSVDDFSFHAETCMEVAETCAEIIGIDIDKIYYSGFWSQGDGACFEGSYRYKKGAVKAIRDYAPEDAELHRIAEGLQKVQREWFYGLRATVRHSGRYYHEFCTDISVEAREQDENRAILRTEEDLSELLRDFMRWIYRQLEKEYEYQNSDEQIDENILANEYEFTEDGERA